MCSKLDRELDFKKELTEYVADEMLTLVQRSLRANQTFVANIKQQAFLVSLDIPVLVLDRMQMEIYRCLPHWTHSDV